MNKVLLKYKFCLAVFVLALISCAHKNKALVQSPVKTETPQIVFLTFSATKDTLTNSVTFSLKNKLIVDGKFKDQEQISVKDSPNYLTLVFGNGTKTMKEVYVEHPLYKRVDVYGDKGVLSSKEISLTTGEFNLRIEQQKGMNKVTLNEFVNFKKTKNTVILNL